MGVVVLNGHSSVETEIYDQLDVTIVVADSQNFARFGRKPLHSCDQDVFFDFYRFEWSNSGQVADVYEPVKSPFTADNKAMVTLLSCVWQDGPDGLWVPIFLRLVLLSRQLTSEPHSSFSFLFSLILLLVLFHLELHDFDPPCLDLSLIPVIAIAVVDLAGNRSGNLVHKACVASEND